MADARVALAGDAALALVPLRRDHVAALGVILDATPEFTADEVAVAREVLAEALTGDGYVALVAERAGVVVGYACFGATPMTESTFDLYWIAVAPSEKRGGVGRALVADVIASVRARGGRVLRVETEGGDRYAATRAFYQRLEFEAAGEIRDFYAAGRALVILVKYL